MPRLDRKQERIVHTLEGPLFVSAGAGSGKTFTLTQRVLYALTPGSRPRELWADPEVPEAFLDSIDQVLAITFTDKAAAELKERIRAALIQTGLAREAERVDGAWISTIHGMCARIIRAHALDLGVDPAFTVADYADDLKRLAAEHVIRRVTDEDADGAGAFDAVLHAFQLEGAQAGSHDLDNLLAILIALLARVSASLTGLDAFRQVPPRPPFRELYEAYREIAEAPSYANNAAAKEAVAALEAWQASPHDLPHLRTCFAACGTLNLRARGMGKDEKDAVADVRAERALFFADAYLAARREALDELVPLAAEVEREYTALKRERGMLDNDDLLALAYDALKNDAAVRAEFAGRFKMVMVDEFQDTAQQQVELVRLLCSPDGRELCTVGDAQQSIYRFRGADVSVFRGKKEEVAAQESRMPTRCSRAGRQTRSGATSCTSTPAGRTAAPAPARSRAPRRRAVRHSSSRAEPPRSALAPRRRPSRRASCASATRRASPPARWSSSWRRSPRRISMPMPCAPPACPAWSRAARRYSAARPRWGSWVRSSTFLPIPMMASGASPRLSPRRSSVSGRRSCSHSPPMWMRRRASSTAGASRAIRSSRAMSWRSSARCRSSRAPARCSPAPSAAWGATASRLSRATS